MPTDPDSALRPELADPDPPDEILCFGCECAVDDSSSLTGPDGEEYCEECFAESFAPCNHCGADIPRDDAYTGRRDGESQTLCDRCRDRHYSTCGDCGESVYDSEMTSVRGQDSVCQNCYDDGDYCYCEVCGDTVHLDDYAGHSRCVNCAPDEDAPDEDEDAPDPSGFLEWDGILNYSNTSALKRRGKFGAPKDRTWFGVELECSLHDGSRNVSDTAERTLGTIGHDFAIAKEDCSINREGNTPGFEVVAAPATPAILAERFGKLFDALEAARKPGGEALLRNLRSWQSGTCGIHVHVSRAGLSSLTIGKMLVFLNEPENRALIVAIAGRSSQRYAAFCAKTFGQARKRYGDRYEALNLTNDQTVEIRIFRGTLRRESFFKNLQFVYSLVAFCRQTGCRALAASDYLAWLLTEAKTYPDLVRVLRAKAYLPEAKRNPKRPEFTLDPEAQTGEI